MRWERRRPSELSRWDEPEKAGIGDASQVGECPPHRGSSWSHRQRPGATPRPLDFSVAMKCPFVVRASGSGCSCGAISVSGHILPALFTKVNSADILKPAD